MAKQRQKSLTYHRAECLDTNSHGFNLEDCINQAIIHLPTVAHRSIERDGGSVIRLAHHGNPKRRPGCLLHLTFETPGEHASIVPSPTMGAPELQTQTHPPPNSAEFMDGDAFLYVVGNHVCLCTTAVRVGTVRYFLQKLFEKANIEQNCTQFTLMNAANTDKLSRIHNEGIKEIQLKASLAHASAEYIRRKTHTIGAIGGVAEFFKAIFWRDDEVVDDALRVGLILHVDGRSKSRISLGRTKLQEIAENIVKNEEKGDDYTIILESGEKIRFSDIVLMKSVEIDGEGKTVRREAAFEALLLYYIELENSGKLEQ